MKMTFDYKVKNFKINKYGELLCTVKLSEHHSESQVMENFKVLISQVSTNLGYFDKPFHMGISKMTGNRYKLEWCVED